MRVHSRASPGVGTRCPIKSEDRNGGGLGPVHDLNDSTRRAGVDVLLALNADQTSSDADQTSSDADQTAATTDQASADEEQRASDRDQATADRDHAAVSVQTAAEERAYAASRSARTTGSARRLGSRIERASTARERDERSTSRDRISDGRDLTHRGLDTLATELARDSDSDASLLEELQELRAQAAADRERAAADRERAARDREKATRERERLEAELHSAHLDELTGAYRREMGRLAISHEIDRARRSDGRFVLAFVDVDDLKTVNDRDGHAAGDRVLQTVVSAIRTRLRSFDPIMRYGGDEFVCGLSGTDLSEAKRRFESIGIAIEADAHVGISVGLAALAADDTPERLAERADAAMLAVKARHHSRA
jgi:diguanylate cyclase (GGDEF)-like protein